MKLSIVIPTRGRPEQLERCLRSIAEHTNNCEVIVVDHEGGLNEKINYGMRRATGDYIALLHDDVEVTEGWVNVVAEVGSFKIGENNNSFDCWGGIADGYCTDQSQNPEYSAFLLLSREAYARIGQTDEAYKEPGYQDVDFGRQIQAAGYKISCLPGKIIHRHARTAPLSETNRQYLEKKWQ